MVVAVIYHLDLLGMKNQVSHLWCLAKKLLRTHTLELPKVDLNLFVGLNHSPAFPSAQPRPLGFPSMAVSPTVLITWALLKELTRN